MPNISEFKQECAALGLSHIEVVQGDREPDVTLDMIKNGQVENGQITTGTYEYYEPELKKLDIVFFSQDDVIQGVTFIGNSVFFTESGGSEESWTYKTKNINIPVDGGIRTFSGAMKDELFAMGIMGIIADSIDERDQHDNYLDNSLYGKIESKLHALMQKEGKTTIEGLKIPWLYNIMVFRCSGSGSGQSDYRAQVTDHIGNNGWASAGTENMDSALYCSLDSFDSSSNSYLYKIGYNFRSNDSGLTWIINGSGTYPVRTGKGTTTWEYANEHYLKAWNSQHYATSYGGWNQPLYSGTSGHPGGTDQPINQTKFKTQPYVYGMVLMITQVMEHGGSLEIPMIGGYINLIGLDRNGHIIQPVPPYVATEQLVLTNGTTTAGSQIRFEITDTELNTYLGNGIEYMGDYCQNTRFTPLKGKTVLEVCIPIRAEELNYAKNVDYIIAPNELIPDNYFDDES